MAKKKIRNLNPEEIECRVGTVMEQGITLLLYKNARVDQTILDEVMVHNARMIEPEDLASVLDDTIKEATPEGDVLTEHIYYYNAETDQIEMLK